MEDQEIKKRLFEYCVGYVSERLKLLKQAIYMAQNAANEDSKSSMGDKYETGKAMAQLEIEKSTAQLAEFTKMKNELERLPLHVKSTQVQKGTLVFTSNGPFFISVSVGKIVLDGESYFAVSSVSPIGSLLLGRKEGEEAMLNGKVIKITQLK